MDVEMLFSDAQKHRNDVIKHHGKTEEDIRGYIRIIKEWILTQPHLPELPDDAFIERYLLLCKFSIENLKRKLDMRYTIRSLIPDFFENKHPKLPHIQNAARTAFWVVIPKLDKNLSRTAIFKVNRPDDDLNIVDFVGYTFYIAEVRMHEDYCLADNYILDYGGTRLKHAISYTPMIIKKSMTIIEKVFASRIKGLHFLNCPPFAENAISVTKSVVKPKLRSRIHVHKDIESLYEFIPKEILPRDYGGDELSLEELNELWQKKLEQYYDKFDRLDSLKVNEKLRPEKLIDDEVLGFHGNFKTLNVD